MISLFTLFLILLVGLKKNRFFSKKKKKKTSSRIPNIFFIKQDSIEFFSQFKNIFEKNFDRLHFSKMGFSQKKKFLTKSGRFFFLFEFFFCQDKRSSQDLQEGCFRIYYFDLRTFLPILRFPRLF